MRKAKNTILSVLFSVTVIMTVLPTRITLAEDSATKNETKKVCGYGQRYAQEMRERFHTTPKENSDTGPSTFDLNSMMTGIRGVPYFKEGVPIGLRLFAMKIGSFWEQTGFKNGDVLLSIDQKPATRILSVSELMDKILSEEKGSHEFVIMREQAYYKIIVETEALMQVDGLKQATFRVLGSKSESTTLEKLPPFPTRDSADFFTQARVVPYFKEGSSIGMRLFAIKPGSFLFEAGFRNGDIISKVDQTEVLQYETFQKVIGEIQANRGTHTFQVQRMREDIALTVDWSKVAPTDSKPIE